MKKICETCSKEFNAPRKTTKYCSKKCSSLALRKRITLTCTYCGKEFETFQCRTKRDMKYCSQECAGLARRTLVLLPCPICGKEFHDDNSVDRRRKYCSDECSSIASSMRQKYQPVFVFCKNCNKEFETNTWQVEHSGGKFCCHKCYGEWRSKELVGEKSPLYKGLVEQKCEWCSKIFFVKPYIDKNRKNKFCSKECKMANTKNKNIYQDDPSHGGRYKKRICEVCNTVFYQKNLSNPGRFCSRKCRGEFIHRLPKEQQLNWKGGLVTIKCQWCGNEFEVSHYREKTGKYCSRSCRSYARNGKLSPSWIDGNGFDPYPPDFNRGLKKFIRERDGFECVLCGEPEDKEKHCCHHVSYRKDDNRTQNLLLLCRKCHSLTNTNRLYWQTRLSSLMGALGY